jgi:CRISPR-associated protein Cmr5
MKKRVEEYIEKAIKLIEYDLENEKIESLPSSFNGYISSFGAALIQSDLKIAIALFENKKSSKKANSKYLMNLILRLIDENTKEDMLLKYVIKSNENENVLKEKIKDAAIAIKLAIRTFDLKDE